jgi:hypothetical protein
METVPHLCDRCSQISFDALSCPTAVDLYRARKAVENNNAYPKFLPFRERQARNKQVEQQRVIIGPVDRVRKALASCHLCAFVYDAITRGGDLPDPKGSELIVTVNPDTSYHGFITDSRTDVEGNWQESYFVLRRLSVTVEVDSRPLAYFDHIAQPCTVGAMSSHEFPFLFSPTSQSEMYFAGRKRPQTINLDWLRYWIRTCEADHGDDCTLVEEQSETSL